MVSFAIQYNGYFGERQPFGCACDLATRRNSCSGYTRKLIALFFSRAPTRDCFGFLYYQYRDHFHDVQDLQFMHGTRSLLHVSEAGSRWGELSHIFESKEQLSETVTKYKVCEL